MKNVIFLFLSFLSSLYVSISLTQLEAKAINQDTGNVGLGYYGLFHEKWPCQDSYDAFNNKDHIRIATLWDSFRYPNVDPNNDPSLNCLKKFIEDPRFDYFEVHLINEVCQRNKRCQPHTDLLHGLTVNEYKKRIKERDFLTIVRIQMHANDFMARVVSKLRPTTHCRVSMGLESNLDSASMKIIHDYVRPIITPRCTFVSSQYIAGVQREAHGVNPGVNPPCIVNLDGADINFKSRPSRASSRINESRLPAYIKKYNKCEATFLWVNEFNGLKPDRSWSPPINRTNWPNRLLFWLVSKYNRRY